MIIFLQVVGRKPGFPSSDLLILKKELMQTGAAWCADVDQVARNGRKRRPQHQRWLRQMNRPRCCKPARMGESIAGAVNRADGRGNRGRGKPCERRVNRGCGPTELM